MNCSLISPDRGKVRREAEGGGFLLCWQEGKKRGAGRKRIPLKSFPGVLSRRRPCLCRDSMTHRRLRSSFTRGHRS